MSNQGGVLGERVFASFFVLLKFHFNKCELQAVASDVNF